MVELFNKLWHRREHPRVPRVLRVWMAGVDAVTQEVSAEGLRFLTTNPPKVEEVVGLVVRLPRGHSVEAEGRVVWTRLLASREPGLWEGGIQFTRMSSRHRARWQRLL